MVTNLTNLNRRGRCYAVYKVLGCVRRLVQLKYWLIAELPGSHTSLELEAMPVTPFGTSARLGMSTLLLLLVLTPGTHAERLPIKIYATADGLPSNEVNKIVRDSRGFLWFCTGDGLARFDGYAFTNFGTDQGLPHHNVTDLLETRGGEYWIATNGGLVRFNPQGAASRNVNNAKDSAASDQMFTLVVPDDEDLAARAVVVLFEDQAGVIWCGTAKGLFRLERNEGHLVLQPVEIGMPHDYREETYVSDIVQDRTGTLWIASPSGLYQRKAGGALEKVHGARWFAGPVPAGLIGRS